MTENAVTVEELAVILHCSTEKIYRLARSGEIPGFRIGRSWRFFPQQVIDKLQAPKDPWAQSARSLARRRVTG